MSKKNVGRGWGLNPARTSTSRRNSATQGHRKTLCTPEILEFGLDGDHQP